MKVNLEYTSKSLTLADIKNLKGAKFVVKDALHNRSIELDPHVYVVIDGGDLNCVQSRRVKCCALENGEFPYLPEELEIVRVSIESISLKVIKEYL